ncbi:MAG: PKD domain-containing protein [Thermoplasmatota archaeon]
MKMKKPIMYVIAIAIMGLLITSAYSLPISQSTSQEDEIKAEYLVVQYQPMLKTKNVNKPMHPLFTGVPITGGDYDEYHPSVAGSPVGGFYAMVEETTDGSIWQPTLYGSVDGVVWNPILTALYDNALYTEMDQNAYGTYGTFGPPSDSSGQIIVFQGEIEDGWVWDFGSYNLNEFSNNRIACYTFEGPEGDPGTWNWGAISMTGYNGYGTNNIVGCPFIFYQSSADGSGIISWLTGAVSGCRRVGSVIDPRTNVLYSVYDRYTGTQWELLLRKDNFGLWQYNQAGGYWTHVYMTKMHITDTVANLTNPSVAAYNNSVIIACEKDGDIIVYYSTNGFATKTEVLVQTSASYPEIVMAGGGKAIITYIKNNVLYYRISNDGGANWGDEEVVSDNEVNLNYRAANLDEFGGKVYGVWEDTRGANIDAYFDLIYEYVNTPPNTPTLDGPVKVNKNVPTEYTFSTTDPDGDTVYYYVDWGDGTSTGWITQTVANHTWTKKGKYVITCKAKDEYNAESGTATLSIQVPRTRSIDNLLYRLFEKYLNAFPLLRLIFRY